MNEPEHRTGPALPAGTDPTAWTSPRRVLPDVIRFAEVEAPEIVAGAFGLAVPLWLSLQLAHETGGSIDWLTGGVVEIRVDGQRVIGARQLGDAHSPGQLIVQDQQTAAIRPLSLRCHPYLAPHRWWDLTEGLAAGLSLSAAVAVASLGD